MTRRLTAPLALILALAFIAFDIAASPPNPYNAPAAFAFGSGLSQSGGFCGALPD